MQKSNFQQIQIVGMEVGKIFNYCSYYNGSQTWNHDPMMRCSVPEIFRKCNQITDRNPKKILNKYTKPWKFWQKQFKMLLSSNKHYMSSHLIYSYEIQQPSGMNLLKLWHKSWCCNQFWCYIKQPQCRFSRIKVFMYLIIIITYLLNITTPSI